jgi:outer membrane protein OmpA-like peptidoglycan-associated protein
VDVLYNLSTALGGYKESRFWEFIPFLQGGLVVGTGNGNVSTMGLGGGLINALRLSKAVDLTLEIAAVISPESAFRHGHERFVVFPSASLGLSFNLGKSDFQVYRPAPLVDLPDYVGMIAALKDELSGTISKLGSANETIDNLKKKLATYSNLVNGKTYLFKDGAFTEAEPKTAEAQPEIFYFDISKTTLSERELARLEFYAKNTFKKDQQLLITGGADAGTGSAAVNERLSRQRAEYVKNMLVNTYGFNPANLETAAEVLGTDSPIKGRIVTIRVK